MKKAPAKKRSDAASAAAKDMKRQRQYVQQMKEAGFDYSIVVGDAFVRGIRDLGYRDTATALDELIDNSIQAGASHVQVLFRLPREGSAKPDAIAIVDDGHGMEPEMVRLAMSWGGTHREGDRTGFGRYGYGLPSASLSQGRRFTVYSRTAKRAVHAVTLDLDEISAGKWTRRGQVHVPEAVAQPLPDWVRTALKGKNKSMTSGTAIVIEKLDKLSWRTHKKLQERLIDHFGITYRNFLREVRIEVAGSPVKALDPLFLTKGARYYDIDSDRAAELPGLTFDVPSQDGNSKGRIHIRFCTFPPTFARAVDDKSRDRGRPNERMTVLRDTLGIIVLRNGRQVDIIRHGCPWTSFLNNDRYWGLEIDFPASLDEDFRVTTSKQQVTISERMWDLLKQQGVLERITQMRMKYSDAVAQLRVYEESPSPRASEVAMQQAARLSASRPDPAARRRRSLQLLEEELRLRPPLRSEASTTLIPQLVLASGDGHGYKVVPEELPGAPFFRPVQVDGHIVLLLNTAHRFFSEIYASPDSTERMQSALEVLLFVIGEAELQAATTKQRLYETERVRWSAMLELALTRLTKVANDSVGIPTPEHEATIVPLH